MKDRRWQVGVLFLGFAVFALGGLIAQDSLAPKVLRAQRFELLDAESRLHAVIGFDSTKSARITVYDTAGKVAWTAPVTNQPASQVAAEPSKPPEQKQEGLGLVVYGCKLEAESVGQYGSHGGLLGTKTVGYNATGYVRNDSGKAYERIILRFCYIDARGIRIGSGFAVTTDLAPGAVWNFKVPVITDGQDKNVRPFTVVSVEAQ
jgi:hypothetical protein